MTLLPNRREALAIGASAAATALLPLSALPAFAANNANELIEKFTGGKKPTEGKVKLDLPEIAIDNGRLETEAGDGVWRVPRVIDRITEMMITRAGESKKYGVIALAEGLAEFLPREYLKGIPRDDHGQTASRHLQAHG